MSRSNGLTSLKKRLITDAYDHSIPTGEVRHGGIARKYTREDAKTDVFLSIQVIVTTNALWHGAYSDYSASLHQLIINLKAEGLSDKLIATLLNAESINSPRGKRWSPSSVWSIVKKRAVRDERLNSAPTIEMGTRKLIYRSGSESFERDI